MLVWKSDPVAIIDGTNSKSLKEKHERIKYSSPLIANNHAYVGIADAYFDRPLQNGRIVAVDLVTGHIDPSFSYISTGTHRGGAVWNSPAADANGVYFTTGNTRHDNLGDQVPEPSPNHGLSMLRVDKDSGIVIWKFQPVPYALDDDPDWAAGATVMSTSCGELIASVQKDGWAYAVAAGDGTQGALNVRWQFPPTGYPFAGGVHGNDDYKHPGAAWNDVFIVTTGGEARTIDGPTPGYGKLHAINSCATSEATRLEQSHETDRRLSNLIDYLVLFRKDHDAPSKEAGYFDKEQYSARKTFNDMYLSFNSQAWWWHWNVKSESSLSALATHEESKQVSQLARQYSDALNECVGAVTSLWDPFLKRPYDPSNAQYNVLIKKASDDLTKARQKKDAIALEMARIFASR
jgi:hypothetical protein